MARGMRVCAMVLSLVVGMILLNNHYGVEAQDHHVVGGDNGWNPSTDIKSWSSNRDFKVGDSIWFTYSVDEDSSISELKTREEYEACDVSNPIRMFTDGVDKVSLDGEGTRYFVSAKSDNCKNGLKLDVEVLPQTSTNAAAVAARHETQFWTPPPVTPSARQPPPPPPATPSTPPPPPPPPPPATPSASSPLGLQMVSSTMMVISFGLVGLLLFS